VRLNILQSTPELLARDTPETPDKKKRDAFKHLSKIAAQKALKKQTATAIGLSQNILRTSVDMGVVGITIHAPRHD
jgi:hypothetical protein